MLAPVLRAAETDIPADAAHRVSADDPAWRELAGGLRAQAAVTATFTENRWFPFRKVPTVLKGEVRVSAGHGLSLHYRDPQEQTVIIDDQGMLVRGPKGDNAPPAGAEAAAANSALLHVLRFDLRGLAETFDLYGTRTDTAWRLALVPKDDALRRTLGRIAIEGAGPAVRRIELRRSAVQRVEILIDPPQTSAVFSPEDLKRFFR
ncbi:MAG TPA: outer membrane lipoprotein carrier protein LolA [Opitutaceae bacterium]|nr:outer membrane lipoprotein carrier protein LolA [Opitutaceae bacterium]